MFRLVMLVLIVASLLHFTGWLDYGKIKSRLSGTDKGVGDFYNQKAPATPSTDKAKEFFSGNEGTSQSPPPSSKPTWSEGEGDPRKMNIVTEPERNRYCFYPDASQDCPPPRKK